MTTIIARVLQALRDNGEGALADHFHEHMKALVGLIQKEQGLHDQLRKIMRTYINTVQARCRHTAWIVCHTNQEGDPATWGPEDSISCVGCGHTVCDEEAAKWGKEVVQRQRLLYSLGERKFTLSSHIKQKLGDKLIVKEVKDEETKTHSG